MALPTSGVAEPMGVKVIGLMPMICVVRVVVFES
jgi:hypothetical protein